MSSISLTENILGFFCLITAQIRFLLPGLDIYEIYKTRITHKFPYYVLICNLGNNTLWLIYFEHIYLGDHVWFNMALGFIESITYLLLFIYCLDLDLVTKIFRMAFTVMIPFFMILMWNSLGIKVEITGYLGTLFNISMFVAPMQKVKLCIEEKDNEYLPIKIIFITLMGSIGFLFLFGIYRWNNLLLFVHTFSVIISSFQIYIWNYYRKDDFVENIIARKESIISFDAFSQSKKSKNNMLKNNFKKSYNLKTTPLKDDFQ